MTSTSTSSSSVAVDALRFERLAREGVLARRDLH
jgi:hypothetical protein